MSSLADRKKARASRKTAMRTKIESGTAKKTDFTDDRKWLCSKNDAGLGQAVIRFLEPSEKDMEYFTAKGMDEDEVPFYVKQHTHGFKGKNGKWYIENCPTSVVNRECPVCEANSVVVDENGGWNAMDDAHPGKKLVRDRKRREVYYANVLVVEDKAVPENEGKVKIFQYGKAIHDMIMSKLMPDFDDEESVDVSNFWDGADFRMKITRKDGYTSYEKSTWAKTKPLGTDDEIQAVLDQQHALSSFVSDDKYKDYDTLKKQFLRAYPDAVVASKEMDDGVADLEETPVEKKPVAKKAAKKEVVADEGAEDDDYFATLLDDD